MFIAQKSKLFSSALTLALSLPLVTGLAPCQTQAKTKATTVYVLESVNVKYDHDDSSINTKLTYNKNGSAKKIISDIIRNEPVKAPDNTNVISEENKTNPPEIKKVEYKRKTYLAYKKNGKLSTVTSYKGKVKARLMKFEYKKKSGLMKGIEMKDYDDQHPMQSNYVSITKRDKKNRITGFKTLSPDKKDVRSRFTIKYNKKGLQSKAVSTIKIPKASTITIKYNYDKHNNIKEVKGSVNQSSTYKKGLLVKQKKSIKEPFGLITKSTITFKYKKITVSASQAAAVEKQQWALRNMDDYQSPVFDELIF